MPVTCPVCNSEVIRDEDEKVLRCISDNCSAKTKARIKHFASKGAFDIDGLGDKLIDQMVEKQILLTYADLFDLKEEMLYNLNHMGPKSSVNLIYAIEKSKTIGFRRFLYALGIRHVGEHVAGILADSFKNLEQLSRATQADLESLDGIGQVVAESIVYFFRQKETQITIQRLFNAGV